MHRVSGGWGIQELEFGALLRCEDGTRLAVGSRILFSGPQPLDEHNGFSIDEVDAFEGLHIHGRIGPRGGSGTLETTIAALTQDEQAQTCSSKERTWSVRRTSPALTTACCTPHATGLSATLTMSMRVQGGTTHVTRSWRTDGAAQTAHVGRSRHYS